MKKIDFSKIKNLPGAPWNLVLNALATLPIGTKIPIPSTRSEYETMKKSLEGRTDDEAKDTIAFIDFLFRHAELGNVKFREECL
jgi:hypothetical protein